MDIRPIPDAQGVGFFSLSPVPEAQGRRYREEVVGRYHNYHFTVDNHEWPEVDYARQLFVVDAFSPNLDKKLHVGHMRNLALAASLQRLLPNSKFVALLGAKGILKSAQDDLQRWFDFVNYKPALYYDVLMPQDEDIVVRRKAMMPKKSGTERHPTVVHEECTVWDGPHGPVIVLRNDGRPLYTFHDIAFAKTVGPTHYITGQEQRDHFKSLGLDDRHRPMGLVLGKNDAGKWEKMKSRSGDAVTAEEVMQTIMDKLLASRATVEKTKLADENVRKLAWNVIAWNMLSCSREKDVKFDVDKWTDPNSGGLYITYTYARIWSALNKAGKQYAASEFQFDPQMQSSIKQGKSAFSMIRGEIQRPDPDPHYDMTDLDLNIAGWANYKEYYRQRAIEAFDPNPIAHYAYNLAQKAGNAYHQERIDGGRYAFCYALYHAAETLKQCMNALSMFPLEAV